MIYTRDFERDLFLNRFVILGKCPNPQWRAIEPMLKLGVDEALILV